MLLNKV